MLDSSGVEIGKFQFNYPALNIGAKSSPTPKPQQLPISPANNESLPQKLGETVTLSSPSVIVPAGPTAQVETGDATTQGGPAQSTSSVPTFQNGPLTMGLDELPNPVIRFKTATTSSGLEPAYMDEIRVLDSRYPGVADKLKDMEVQAAQNGYCPVESKKVEASLLESPPWPTTSFGDAFENITAKAAELRSNNPELATNDATTYDFAKAALAAEDFREKMKQAFKEDMPDLTISTRAKTPKSLANKMTKMLSKDPNYTMAHLTDTVGARIDAPDLHSMGEVAKRLEKMYEGKIVAKSDYVSQPGENGYRAIHYIIDIGGRMAEIQTSTHDLRMADLATHDTVYKAEFPVSPEASKELSTAADRIMYLECLKAKGCGC